MPVKRRPKSADFYTNVVYLMIANVGGSWADVSTSITTEAILVDQPEKIELKYCIIAVNKAGEGQPSNTVIVVL